MKKISNKDLKKVNGGATKSSPKKTTKPVVEAKSVKNTKTGKVITTSSSKKVTALNLPKTNSTKKSSKK